MMSGEITNIPWKNNQQIWLTFPEVKHEELQFSRQNIWNVSRSLIFYPALQNREKSSVFS